MHWESHLVPFGDCIGEGDPQSHMASQYGGEPVEKGRNLDVTNNYPKNYDDDQKVNKLVS